jgi:uncharacterized protein
MLCHLSALAGYIIPLGNVLGPFLIWQIKKNEMPAIEGPAKDALNFQITMLIAAIVCFILVFVAIGIFLLPILGVFALVCIVIAAVKANNGERWKYPLSFKFLQ